MSVVVRATEADAVDVFDIVTEYFVAIDVLAEDRDTRDEIAVYLRDPCALWLAREGEAVVGVIALRPLASIDAACEIKRFYVRPDHRGQGLADTLLDTLEADAIARGYTFAYLDTRADLRTAITLYERRGYQHCERYNDHEEATVFMRRRLVP